VTESRSPGDTGVLNASFQTLNACNEAFKARPSRRGDAVNDPFQTLNDINAPFQTSARRPGAARGALKAPFGASPFEMEPLW
jgi:hypothetical protein